MKMQWFILRGLTAFAIIVSVIVYSVSCSDSFTDSIAEEKFTNRELSGSYSLVSNTKSITLNEGGEPVIVRVKLTDRPLGDVVFRLSLASQVCTTEGIVETLLVSSDDIIFTPENYNVERNIEIDLVFDDALAMGTRNHLISFPALESEDPLYDGKFVSEIYVTVYDDDTKPLAFPAAPFINETSVPEYSDVIVTFNRDMDPGTITETSFTLKDESGNSLPAYVRYYPSERKACLSPKGYLHSSELHRAEVDQSVKDLHGNPLYEKVMWEFTSKTYTNPDPVIRASWGVYGYARSLAIKDDYAYVTFDTSGSDGLYVIDVSVPNEPLLVGKSSLSGSIRDHAINGNYAYVGVDGQGICVIDIADKSNPVFVGNYNPPADDPDNWQNYQYGAFSIKVSDDKLFINYQKYSMDGVDVFYGMQILDIADPEHPLHIGSCNLANQSDGIAISNNYAFVVGTGIGLQIIDISNPELPVIIGSNSEPSNAVNVVVKRNYAYVTDLSHGLKVFNIFNPSFPIQKGSFDTSGYAIGVDVSNTHAFVADGSGGLQILDINTPASPFSVGACMTQGGAVRAVVSRNYVFVLDDEFGLQCIRHPYGE